MPAYTPLSSVMPVASMVTGAAVTAALGDQMRDNVVALYEGWWFRAIRTTTQSIAASTGTTILFESMTQSATSLADGSITLGGGSVTTRRPGMWHVGGSIELTAVSGGTLVLSLDSTNSPGGVYTAQGANDTANNKDAMSVSITTMVTTTPNVFSLDIFNTSSCIIRSGQLTTALWGVWMGDTP